MIFKENMEKIKISKEKIKISKVIIVEGKYDKIKVNSIVDGLIIQTDGFRIYKDKEKIALIKALALKYGIIIVTDSDAAGFQLRNFIRSIAKDANITNIYIPQIKGKEKRKETPGKENLLGVEGMDVKTLRELFLNADNHDCIKNIKHPITKMDFYEDGLIGQENSSVKRNELLKYLNLPNYISTNSLLSVINHFMTYEEYQNYLNTSKGG